MLEIPEAAVISRQLSQTVIGRSIAGVTAAASPHSFTWYYEDPQDYDELLRGKRIENAAAYGGRVEMEAQGAVIQIADGVGLRYHAPGEKRPVKHQLLVELDDGAALSATVTMYGGIWCFPEGAFDNWYCQVSKEKRSPLSEAFDYEYFLSLLDDKSIKLSAKAFLATEQRIPGLGNGVLQDILLCAGIHPKQKMISLADAQIEALFTAVRGILLAMTEAGGRDTERNLHGCPGGYVTKLSKNNKMRICPVCGSAVTREAYLGGNIYYCGNCQPY